MKYRTSVTTAAVYLACLSLGNDWGGRFLAVQAFSTIVTRQPLKPRLQLFHNSRIEEMSSSRYDESRREFRRLPAINSRTTTTTSTTSQQTTTGLFMSPNNELKYDENTVPQVYPQRWIQLGYLSILALISDWICFSVAAVPSTYEMAFHHSAAQLIDFFLFTNVVTSFLVTDFVDKFGLQKSIQGAAVLMALGCWLRSGLSFLPVLPQAPHLMSYASVVIGTVLVGAAQPFFQCTPPVLSATWFASSERATSTAIALNFNQIGIAIAFLVGGAMATTIRGLELYFGLIALLATVTAIGAFLQFQNEPPIPPSTSELEKKLKNFEEPPFLESVQKFFKTRGFTNALAAFICSISITNIVGAFLDDIMHRGGITNQLNIDLAGAGFELAILVGGDRKSVV